MSGKNLRRMLDCKGVHKKISDCNSVKHGFRNTFFRERKSLAVKDLRFNYKMCLSCGLYKWNSSM